MCLTGALSNPLQCLCQHVLNEPFVGVCDHSLSISHNNKNLVTSYKFPGEFEKLP